MHAREVARKQAGRMVSTPQAQTAPESLTGCQMPRVRPTPQPSMQVGVMHCNAPQTSTDKALHGAASAASPCMHFPPKQTPPAEPCLWLAPPKLSTTARATYRRNRSAVLSPRTAMGVGAPGAHHASVRLIFVAFSPQLTLVASTFCPSHAAAAVCLRLSHCSPLGTTLASASVFSRPVQTGSTRGAGKPCSSSLVEVAALPLCCRVAKKSFLTGTSGY